VRHRLGWVAIVWLLCLCAVGLAAYGSPAASTSLQDRTQAVAQQLRCLVCQGESVADSPSDLASAMRKLIRAQLAQGRSADEIKTYLVARYGDRILLAPPASGIGGFAWLAPPLLLLGGVALLLTLVVDWRGRGRAPATGGRAAYIARVRAEVAGEE
jgi:cytochrome c-type biogenesis protein CcmH